MPQTVYTAFDTGGQTKLTDMDQIAEQRRREMQDQAFRGALLNNQNNMQREGWGRQDALAQQNLGSQERIAQMGNQTQLAMNGAYGDRAANARELTALQMSPALKAQELERMKWEEGGGLRNAKNANELAILQKKNQILTGGGSGPIDRVGAALLGLPSDIAEDPNDRYFRDLIKAQVASGAVDPADAMAALKSGNYSAIPKKEVTAIGPEQQIAALQGDVERFGQKDAATFGFDPVEEDVSRLVAQRDQAAKALKAQNPRLSDAQAIEGANFYVEESLKKGGTDQRWGTEWIAKLREALRGRPATGGQMPTMLNAAGTSDRGY